MSNLIVYSASAGSGKTYTLAREYILQVIQRPFSYRSILAVTFTNKATEEMKVRIIKELHDLAIFDGAGAKQPSYLSYLVETLGDELRATIKKTNSNLTVEHEIARRAKVVQTSILHDYSNFAISTIDKFFQKVVRNFVSELNIQPGYALELDTDKVLTLAVDRVLEGLFEDETLQRWLLDLVEERLNAGENWELSDVLYGLGRQLLGEDFQSMQNDYLEKIGNKDYLENYYARLVESDKQNEENYKKLGETALAYMDSNLLSSDDFPGKSRSFATIFGKAAVGDTPSSYKSASDAYNNPDKWIKGKITDAVYRKLNPILGEIVSYLDFGCNKYKVIIKNFRTLGVLADIEKQVRQLANDENLLLISDTNFLINKLIEDADAPFIYEKMGNRYSSFLIDEFQDTSSTQYQNFKPLLENSLASGGRSLVVGDVKQSIYRWRNGDWKTLGSVVFNDFSTNKIVLDTNFRSKHEVVEFNNKVFPLLANGLMQKFEQEAGALETEKSIVEIYEDVHQKVPQSASKNGGFVQIERFDGEENMSTSERLDAVLDKMVAEIERLQNEFGYKPSDIAILVRRQKEGQMVANALLAAKNRAAEKDKHLYNFISQGALYLTSSQSVNLIIALFRLAVHEQESISKALISYIEELEAGTPIQHGSFSSTSQEKIDNLLAAIDKKPIYEAVETIISEFGLNRNTSELPFLGDFCDIVLNFADKKTADIRSFIEWWNDKGATTELYIPGKEEAITILTIHKSKGLQYGVVFVPFCNWDVEPSSGFNKTTLWVDGSDLNFDGYMLEKLPVHYGKALQKSIFANDAYKEQLQSYIDNINLTYVAFTRAEKELYIYIPKAGKNKSNNIGRFVFDTALILTKEEGVELSEDENVISFGERLHATDSPKDSSDSIPLRSFRIGKPLSKIRQNFAASAANGAKNLKKGLLMHRLFSLIKVASDIPDAVQLLVAEGALLDSEAKEIAVAIEEKMQNPMISSWFDPRYKVVTEGDIIIPGNDYSVKRPDRVMQSSEETIVVDFKFGEQQKSAYKYQLFSYINTLRKMGYRNVHGYIWYYDNDEVEEAE